MEKYPHITIEFIETDLTRMYAMLASGSPLDMFRIFGTFVPGLVLQHIPLDLTEYFSISSVLKPDDLLPVNDLYLVHNRRYGMVKDWSPDSSIWINKSLWEEAGVTPPEPLTSLTLEEWRELSPQLTQKEGDQVLVHGTWFTTSGHPLFWMSCCFGKANGLFTEDFDKIVLLDNPDVYESAKFWADWQKEKGLVSVLNPATAGWSGEGFNNRSAAAVQWGYWFGGMAETEEVPGEDILMLPSPTWGTDYASPCLAGCGAVLTSMTKVPDAAWKVFEWFMGEEPSEARAKSGWGVPGLQSQLELMPQDEPWRQNSYDVVQHEIENTTTAIIDFCPYITPDTFTATWNQYEETMLLGDMTLDEMLKMVEDEVNLAIKEGMARAGLI
jgi:multiple sugar transport system substrate-binding protein